MEVRLNYGRHERILEDVYVYSKLKGEHSDVELRLDDPIKGLKGVSRVFFHSAVIKKVSSDFDGFVDELPFSMKPWMDNRIKLQITGLSPASLNRFAQLIYGGQVQVYDVEDIVDIMFLVKLFRMPLGNIRVRDKAQIDAEEVNNNQVKRHEDLFTKPSAPLLPPENLLEPSPKKSRPNEPSRVPPLQEFQPNPDLMSTPIKPRQMNHGQFMQPQRHPLPRPPQQLWPQESLMQRPQPQRWPQEPMIHRPQPQMWPQGPLQQRPQEPFQRPQEPPPPVQRYRPGPASSKRPQNSSQPQRPILPVHPSPPKRVELVGNTFKVSDLLSDEEEESPEKSPDRSPDRPGSPRESPMNRRLDESPERSPYNSPRPQDERLDVSLATRRSPSPEDSGKIFSYADRVQDSGKSISRTTPVFPTTPGKDDFGSDNEMDSTLVEEVGGEGQERKIECPEDGCRIIFSKRAAVVRHLVLRNEKLLRGKITRPKLNPAGKIICAFCERLFLTELGYLRHVGIRHKLLENHVNEATWIFLNGMAKVNKLEVMSKETPDKPKDVSCLVKGCSEGFPSETELKVHLVEHCSNEIENNFGVSDRDLKCPECPDIFESNSELKFHVAYDHNALVSKIPGEAFMALKRSGNSEHVVKKERTHMVKQEKTYVVKEERTHVVEQETSKPEEKHVVINNNVAVKQEKPLKAKVTITTKLEQFSEKAIASRKPCPYKDICSRTFKQLSDRREHVASAHCRKQICEEAMIADNEKTCKVCDKAFSQPSKLFGHLLFLHRILASRTPKEAMDLMPERNGGHRSTTSSCDRNDDTSRTSNNSDNSQTEQDGGNAASGSGAAPKILEYSSDNEDGEVNNGVEELPENALTMTDMMNMLRK